MLRLQHLLRQVKQGDSAREAKGREGIATLAPAPQIDAKVFQPNENLNNKVINIGT